MTFDELLTAVVGAKGTPARDRHDREVARCYRAQAVLDRSLRLAGWLRFTRPFATTMQWLFEDVAVSRRIRPGGLLDVLAFEYLGDFLFHGRPVTQDYADSWMARVHLPRWMRVR